MAEYSVLHLEVGRKVPIGELYAPLFDLADAFSFNINAHWHYLPDIHKERKNLLRESLKPYFLKKFHTYDWYGWSNADTEVFVYRCCEETEAILRERCPDLLFHLKSGNRRKPVSEFEDLCFYKDNRMILGTLSHEYMCTAYPPLTEDPRLSPIGAWFRGTAHGIYTIPK